MKLWSILAEILHGINDLGAVLYFVKNNEGLFRQNLLTAREHQILQNSVYIFRSFKKLLVFFVFIKVEISGVFVVAFAKFFQNLGFADLTHTFQNQRFAIGRILPIEELL